MPVKTREEQVAITQSFHSNTFKYSYSNTCGDPVTSVTAFHLNQLHTGQQALCVSLLQFMSPYPDLKFT